MAKIFNDDELSLNRIDPLWTAEELLNQTGLFYLKDVSPLLSIHTGGVLQKIRDLKIERADYYDRLGLRRVISHWLVNMQRFAPFYREHLKPTHQKVDPNWDGNDLLDQQGIYLLSDLCKLIPFTTSQLRNHAKNLENAREEMGLFMDHQSKRRQYLVEMPTFKIWIKKVWQNDSVSRGAE